MAFSLFAAPALTVDGVRSNSTGTGTTGCPGVKITPYSLTSFMARRPDGPRAVAGDVQAGVFRTDWSCHSSTGGTGRRQASLLLLLAALDLHTSSETRAIMNRPPAQSLKAPEANDRGTDVTIGVYRS